MIFYHVVVDCIVEWEICVRFCLIEFRILVFSRGLGIWGSSSIFGFWSVNLRAIYGGFGSFLLWLWFFNFEIRFACIRVLCISSVYVFAEKWVVVCVYILCYHGDLWLGMITDILLQSCELLIIYEAQTRHWHIDAIVIWKNDIFECNHVYQCRVGVWHWCVGHRTHL